MDEEKVFEVNSSYTLGWPLFELACAAVSRLSEKQLLLILFALLIYFAVFLRSLQKLPLSPLHFLKFGVSYRRSYFKERRDFYDKGKRNLRLFRRWQDHAHQKTAGLGPEGREAGAH